MSEDKNHRLLLTRRPVWEVGPDDFTLDTAPVPEPGDGQVVVRVQWIAFDPAMRGWMNASPDYTEPVALGEVMRAPAVGAVIASSDPALPVGTTVCGNFGWQEYALAEGSDDLFGGGVEYVGPIERGVSVARPVPEGIPPTAALGVLGLTGLTAYFGMLEVGRPKPGDVVLVSGAAGATGSVAGQLARLAGARVIGIAGGERKTTWLVEEAHFDEAIDYREEDVAARVAELAPDGVDVFYDNVGGPVLEAGIANVAEYGTVVLCGGISSGYSDEAVSVGPSNLGLITVRNATMAGFLVFRFAAHFAQARERLAAWARSGDLVWAEDIQEGTVADAVPVFNRLFHGQNLGKQLLRLAVPAS